MKWYPRDEWPDLRVTLHLLPWTWQIKPRIYADDVEGALGHSSFDWLILRVEWWANKPMFRESRTELAHKGIGEGSVTPHGELVDITNIHWPEAADLRRRLNIVTAVLDAYKGHHKAQHPTCNAYGPGFTADGRPA